MIGRLLEKFLDFVLGPVQPAPASEPETLPEPLPEPPPDPKQVAAQLRALADKLDPLVVPAFPAPEPPYKKWNTVMDESGDTGGKIKRKGAGIEMGKTKENEVLNRIFDAHPGEEEIHLNQDETLALIGAMKATDRGKAKP